MNTFQKRSLQGLAGAAVLMAGLASILIVLGGTSGEQASLKAGIPRHPVIAHRGASWWAPEETLLAYELAMAIGADYLEMDVQRTKDGVIVAFHDDALDRVTDVARHFPDRATQSLDAFTLAELKALEVGTWFNAHRPDRARPEYVGARIATLNEILDRIEADGRRHGVYIETKAPEHFPGIENELVALLKSRGWISQEGAPTSITTRSGKAMSGVILQSFSLESLKALKAVAPGVPRVYLVDEEMEAEAGGFDVLVQRGSEVAQALGPSGYMAWPWKTRIAHDAGLFVHHYTINTPFQLKLMRAFGTDGVFTDRSEIVRAELGLAANSEPPALMTGILSAPRPATKPAPVEAAPDKADGGTEGL
jgi:glycerophosphoryl diester phosphodiesterase